jgi:23S rRNA pseudouridine955/2504/2580 synthase
MTMIAAPDDAGRRLDLLLRKALPDLPLSAIHRLLRKRRVLLDGRPADAATRVKAGAVIAVPLDAQLIAPQTAPQALPRSHVAQPPTPAIAPQAAPRSHVAQPPAPVIAPQAAVHSNVAPLRNAEQPPAPILWEGCGLIALNKPAGLPTHGDNSLETEVRAWLRDKLPPSLSFRSGPLHRLDTPTSGVIMFSSTLEGARYFSALIREHRVRKRYLALIDGRLDREALWEDALVRDKTAKKTFVAEQAVAPNAGTIARPLAFNAAYTLVEVEISTGRTHQIRAQAAFHGHPLAGDRKYGGSLLATGLLLHAASLEFPAPETGRPLIISAPLPSAFHRQISQRDLTDVHAKLRL